MPQVIIKNMVCPRCLTAVREIFGDLNLTLVDLQLGKALLQTPLTSSQKEALKVRLQKVGFELLDDKQTQIINAIKATIIQEIHYQKENSVFNFSTLLHEKLHYDYAYLSRLFSAVEGQTIERFIMSQKIERVKELLTYGELSLSEIAFQMHYSSTAHLSSQFKKISGMTPTAFKKLQRNERKSLDKI